MRRKVGFRYFYNGLAVIWGLLLTGCSLISGSEKVATPSALPFDGAPVTAAVERKMLVINNHTEGIIYQRIFPTDILPFIEWAPCIAPETCPDEQRIDPVDKKQFALKEIVREQTEAITVFWWTYLEKVPGATVPPLEMHEIVVPLP